MYQSCFFVHGFQVFDTHPPLITLMDQGQSGFALMLGFVGTLSLKRHLAKTNGKFPWKKFLIRIAIFLVLMVVIGIISVPDWKNSPTYYEWGFYQWVIFEGTFATLLWSYIVSMVIVFFIPNKPEWRLAIALGIYTIHSTLYAIPIEMQSGR